MDWYKADMQVQGFAPAEDPGGYFSKQDIRLLQAAWLCPCTQGTHLSSQIRSP